MHCLVILLISVLVYPCNVFAADADLEEFAKEQREQLKNDTVNVQEFLDEPWYIRHKGMIVGGAIGLGVLAVGVMTAGAGAAPAAAAGAAASSHLLGTTAVSSLGLYAAGAGGSTVAGALIDNSGNLVIPENKRAAVIDFYDQNYRIWIAQSSTKKEFGERALREIVQFLQN